VLFILLAVSNASAGIVEKTYEYEHDGVKLEGFLAYDDSIKGRRPGIVVFHQWMGITEYERMRARMLAGLGYVALAADVYGKGKRASDREEAIGLSSAYRKDRKLMRARAAAALNALEENKMVDDARTAAIGYCFGGTVALELARSGAEVKGTVSFHGGLDTPDMSDASNIKGKVLVLHGAADKVVSAEQVAGFQKEMSEAGVDWYMVVYAYARHAFTQKGERYNEPADMRSWDEMKDFFGEIFP
jgi:dienelactone hydrolase